MLVLLLLSICMLDMGALRAQDLLPATSSRGEALRLLSAALAIEPRPSEPIKCAFPILVGGREQIRTLGIAEKAAWSMLAGRPTTDTSLLRYGYRIHFDNKADSAAALLDAQGNKIPGTSLAFAESVGTALAYVAALEVGQLGYLPAPQDDGQGGGPELDVYVKNLGNVYGYTEPLNDVIPGGTTPSFMVIHNDFSFVRPIPNRGIPGMKVTVAHEFHHVLQLGNYGFWGFNHQYYYELTSTWMEDVVYPQVNDYYNYLTQGESQFRLPSLTFTSNSQVYYSRAIWGKFVERKFGRDAMRRSWEFIRQYPPLQAADAALREYGSSFAIAFSEWTRWNFYTGSRADTSKSYLEGKDYPEIAQFPRDFVAPSAVLTGSLDPLSARYHQLIIPRSGAAPESLSIAISNTNVGGAIQGSGSEMYECRVADSRLDDSYKETGTGMYASFSAVSPSHWSIWFLLGSNSFQPFGISALGEGVAFPNPFFADGHALVSIPINATQPVTGALQIYSVGMDLMYSSGNQTSTGSGRQVFSWNGIRNDGRLAPTGVYVFVLSLPDEKTITGKIALVQR
jgi:hypothetical protein